MVGSADAAPMSLTKCSIGRLQMHRSPSAGPLADVHPMKDSLGKPAVACEGPWAGPDGLTCVISSDTLFAGGTGQ